MYTRERLTLMYDERDLEREYERRQYQQRMTDAQAKQGTHEGVNRIVCREGKDRYEYTPVWAMEKAS